MEGTIEKMSTRCPYMETLDPCKYIYLSDQGIWDLLNVYFKNYVDGGRVKTQYSFPINLQHQNVKYIIVIM